MSWVVGVRACRGPHHGPRPARHRAARGPDEDEELWLRLLLDRLPDQLEHRADDDAGLRRAEAGPRPRLDDAPTDEVKPDQKDFFRLLYNLLVDADRGPRLPTLFLALGAGRVRALLAPRGGDTPAGFTG